jgi:hypothetical protein
MMQNARGRYVRRNQFKSVRSCKQNPNWAQHISREETLYKRPGDLRSEFERDYTRIIHAKGYRRVKNPHAKHVALCRPLEEAKFLALLFCEPLILFLIFDVAPYLLLIQTNCTDTITAAPEVISPVRFALQRRIALEKLYGRFSL